MLNFLLYLKLKKEIKDKISFDVWVDEYLIHYNYYEDSIEFKLNFRVEHTSRIKPTMNLPKKWNRILTKALSNSY